MRKYINKHARGITVTLTALLLVFVAVSLGSCRFIIGGDDTTGATRRPVTPTAAPTEAPTEAPSEAPSDAPTETPSDAPSELPSGEPTGTPTGEPSDPISDAPTAQPTAAPTAVPTATPTTPVTATPTTPVTATPTTPVTATPTTPVTATPTTPVTATPTESQTTPVGPEPLDFKAWNLLLVNPWNPLPAGYADKITLKALKGTYELDVRAYDDYYQMIADCRAAGNDPAVCSAFRTQETQERLFREKKDSFVKKGYSEAEAYVLAAREVALPGTSEHQLGLAVDLVSYSNWNLNESQEKTPTQKWLMEHSWEYGFILRYPNNKSAVTGIKYEPWHYRYVGKEAAKAIHNSGLCFEEFLEANGIHCHTGEWKVGKLPTCSTAGTMTCTCKTCKQTIVVTIPATGEHTVVTDAAVAPTCTASGKTAGSHCAVCGAVIEAQKTVPAAGHAVVLLPAVAPTCTETGKTAGSRCAVCGMTLTAQKTVAATGHKFSGGSCSECGTLDPNWKPESGVVTSPVHTEPVTPPETEPIPAETFDFTDWNLVPVNPWNQIPEDFVYPTKLRAAAGYSVDDRIYSAYLEMIEACQAAMQKLAKNDDDYKNNLRPKITSGFRDNLTQIKLYYNKVNSVYGNGKKGYTLEEAYIEAARHVTVPGTSEHQLGLAIDMVSYGNRSLNETQEKTVTQQWLMEHSWEYGFIFRYPNDKSAVTGIIYEPWHYRYVGKEAAKAIHNSGLCYEEFLEANGYHTHLGGEWQVGKLPTCTEDGYFVTVCQTCGEEIRAILPGGTSIRKQLEGVTDQTVINNLITVINRLHTAAVTDPAVAPTCTESGLTAGSHCADCGMVITAREVVPALGHTVVTDPGTAPTCTEPGLSDGAHCSVCHEVLTAQEVLPAVGHSFSGGRCTRCGEADPDWQGETEPWTPPETEPEPLPGYDPDFDPAAWEMEYVNVWNPLPDDFTAPTDLHLINGDASLPIDNRIYNEYLVMIKAMQAASLKPKFLSGVVSREAQIAEYYACVDALIASGLTPEEALVAPAALALLPGTNEHETGLGIDLVSKTNSVLDSSQETLAERLWLCEHSWEYGFIPRYPSEKSDLTGVEFAVWHYRYVGTRAAAIIHENGLCFEEYLTANGVHLHKGAWKVGLLPTETTPGFLYCDCPDCVTEEETAKLCIYLPAHFLKETAPTRGLIVLDPGHGGEANAYPAAEGFYEGIQMYRLAGMLRDELTDLGFTVVVTRSGIADRPDLPVRGSLAGALGAKAFLSLHSNAAPSGAPEEEYALKRGAETYYSVADPEGNEAIAAALSAAAAAAMDTPDLGALTKVQAEDPTKDRYGVLRAAAESGCPRAFLIEFGYHTNPEDAAFLTNDECLAALAKAEAAVIDLYF